MVVETWIDVSLCYSDHESASQNFQKDLFKFQHISRSLNRNQSLFWLQLKICAQIASCFQLKVVIETDAIYFEKLSLHRTILKVTLQGLAT